MATMILQGEAERRRGIHYEMDTNAQPLGEGGMGIVYQGISVDEQTGATRPVAIKFLFDDLPAQVYERARREASIQLHNDNLIEMLGFLETNTPDALGTMKTHYHVVSELLDGVSLSDLLEGKAKDRNGQDVAYALKLQHDFRNDPEHFAKTVVISILSGLMALHDAGYIHRDIDPSNIFITADGRIKLIDFGIAKQMNALTTGDKQLTVAGKFMGKPEYAAPELALGDVSHQNQTTDIYAMGILLYQCIVGHTPFEGARHEILERQIREKLPLQVIRNKELRRIIATACDKKQENRYQSAAQMRVALEMLSGAGRSPSRWPIWLAAGGGGTVLLAAVIAGVVYLVGRPAGSEKQVIRDDKQNLVEERSDVSELIVEEDSDVSELIQSDTMAIENGDSKILSWEEIASSDEVQPLDFEKWLNIMNHIRENYWARPTAEMLANIGLEALYEKDDIDEDSIKNVHFLYGRQTKCMTDSLGRLFHTFNGSHAVLFNVSAYTSSGAELCFHNPVDLKDFMQQAIKRGVAVSPNGSYIVCDKPMGEGVHKLKKVYEHTEHKKGAFKELYYLDALYEPNEDWQVCYVVLDFLRHRIDVE